MNYPIDYDYPLFRPPSEGNSVIFQATYGCSWNNCTFCEMYKTKKFKVKSEQTLYAEIEKFKGKFESPVKIFLADGDSFVLSYKKLSAIVTELKKSFPKIQRIGAYALPKNILSKSLDELKSLQEQGVKILYIGVESGDDDLLKMVNKGETYNSTLDALLLLKEAGIKSSVMILNGLGGLNYSHQHAENSAKLLKASQPEFFSTLVLSFPFGENHYTKQFPGEYKAMSIIELLKELRIMIEESMLKSSIFRCDHASNYLALKGVLSKDKEKILNTIDNAVSNPTNAKFREEWQRGL
jgi:radical SAM superfamily enzyme YgiQ (UPF0313 family)